MDLDTLKRDHPDLYGQVLEQGKQAVRAETEQKIKDAVSEAVTAESERVLGLAGAVMGEDVADNFTRVVKSGASVEQIQALKGIFGQESSEEHTGQEGGDGDERDAAAAGKGTSRAAILAALQQGHSQGVNPQKGRESAAAQGGPDDIEKQASEYVRLMTA